jgi:hypothetical protein
MPKEARLLKDLAYTRSGDKGDVSNIGVLAFDHHAYDMLRRALTPERLKAHFGSMVRGSVEVYEMPNIEALQIVMHKALGGGATRTLRFDQTGKAMATALQRMEIPDEA